MTLDEAIEKNLKKEIQQGYLDLGNEDEFSVEVSRESINTVTTYLYYHLKKNFIKVTSNEEYALKIKEIFGIDFQRKDILMYENSIGEVYPKKFLILSESEGASVLLSSKNLIMPPFRLPEIINYQRLYPKLVKEENELEGKQSGDNEQILWKEMLGNSEEYQKSINDNIDYVINLNKYLFSDDKTHLSWLMEQNSFLETLVSVYGYDQDIELVEKVLDLRGVDEEFYLDDLIWHKKSKRLYGSEEEPKYDGEFKILGNTLQVIYNKLEEQKFHVPTQNVYLKALHRMLVEIEDEEVLNEKEKERVRDVLLEFLSEFILNVMNLESLEQYSLEE